MAAGAVPHDLSAEILAKLPVKTLLRFHCVCKTWYSLITFDPQFSNNHMRPCILLCVDHRKFSTITTESLLTIKDPTPTPLPLPWETDPDRKNICLGSCNGLICVDHKHSFRSCRKSSLILWNPSTRKFKRVPYPGYDSFNHDVWAYDWFWFGYDEPIDDYKLVWLSCVNHKRGRKLAKFDVFTLKSNTWRRQSVEDVAICGISRFFGRTIGVLSNGAVHWIIRYNPPSGGGGGSGVRIMAFDLAAENFRVLKFSRDELRQSSWIGSLGGCLCLCTDRNINDGRRELWVMKEYGVESSWTKLLTITLPYNTGVLHLLSFYPFLLSKEEGKEIVASCGDKILKFRVEVGGGGEVRFKKTLLTTCYGVIISQDLHMEESLVSLSN